MIAVTGQWFPGSGWNPGFSPATGRSGRSALARRRTIGPLRQTIRPATRTGSPPGIKAFRWAPGCSARRWWLGRAVADRVGRPGRFLVGRLPGRAVPRRHGSDRNASMPGGLQRSFDCRERFVGPPEPGRISRRPSPVPGRRPLQPRSRASCPRPGWPPRCGFRRRVFRRCVPGACSPCADWCRGCRRYPYWSCPGSPSRGLRLPAG